MSTCPGYFQEEMNIFKWLKQPSFYVGQVLSSYIVFTSDGALVHYVSLMVLDENFPVLVKNLKSKMKLI